jgi:hypothetical protein
MGLTFDQYRASPLLPIFLIFKMISWGVCTQIWARKSVVCRGSITVMGSPRRSPLPNWAHIWHKTGTFFSRPYSDFGTQKGVACASLKGWVETAEIPMAEAVFRKDRREITFFFFFIDTSLRV